MVGASLVDELRVHIVDGRVHHSQRIPIGSRNAIRAAGMTLGSHTGSPVEFSVAPEFAAHFARLKQVFLYINDECNLGCEQCIYKPHVLYNERREIPAPTAIGLLEAFHGLGARKLTILGGEPTLYGSRDGHWPLSSVVKAARRLGFEHLRIDTNGHFAQRVFDAGALVDLDEIAFSLDGFDPTTNDKLRGDGTFERVVRRIRQAVSRGIRCSITCCIHRDLVKEAGGEYGVERVIRLGEELGVDTVNFHDLFKAGVPMDAWTGSFDTTVEEHVRMYTDVRRKIENGSFRVSVRLPQCFVRKEEFERNPEYYGYCPVKMGERVMVHSDGVIRICSNLICSSFGSGRWEESSIVWNRTSSNETLHHDMKRYTPCTNRSKNRSYGEYVPLCFSFKPNQDEYAWQGLGWDDRRTVSLTPAVIAGDDKPRRVFAELPMLATEPTTTPAASCASPGQGLS
jgi:MoaA/NifB/PqqE/SkfB family radical SAM enzyme